MSTPLLRIRRGAIVLAVIAVVAVVGHHLLSGKDLQSGESWLASLYFFVITVSSVGYAEVSEVSPALQAFTIVVIVVGMSAAAYTVGGLIQMMTEGEIERALGVRRATRELKRLDQHVIICGYGRVGALIAHDLAQHDQPILAIDSNPERIGEAQLAGFLTLTGDATEEVVLQQAGIERARALVSALPDDADNVFLVLTSRNLNAQLNLIARGEHPTSEKKLIQAGANYVVLPAVIGARRMSALLLRPHTAQLLDKISNRDSLEIDAQEILVPETSKLVGMSVQDAEAHRRHRMLVVAIRRNDGTMVFNPNADETFHAGDLLITMGRRDGIDEFRKRFSL